MASTRPAHDQKNASSRTVVITGLVPAIPPRDALPLASVMPGFMPGIHVLKTRRKEDVDGRDKPGHDSEKQCLASVGCEDYVPSPRDRL